MKKYSCHGKVSEGDVFCHVYVYLSDGTIRIMDYSLDYSLDYGF